MILTEEQRESFESVARPMIAWLNEHCYPHVSVITDCTKAELLEGVNSFNTDDYIRDYMVDDLPTPGSCVPPAVKDLGDIELNDEWEEKG